MPLQDHFHPPLSLMRNWHGFHNGWASAITEAVNELLPANFFAQPNVQFGIEIDVAAFDATGGSNGFHDSSWHAPAASMSIALPVLQDTVEVNIFDTTNGPVLVGAIEIISPSNKDRPDSAAAFISKCASLVQNGVALVLVDIVTQKPHDLHRLLLERLQAAGDRFSDKRLFAASYRPIKRNDQPVLDIWHETLDVGKPMPTMPLCLRGELCVPIDLESTYERTRHGQRIGDGR